MKPFIFAIALMAMVGCATKSPPIETPEGPVLLGRNAQGHYVFDLGGLRAACAFTSNAMVLCRTENEDWFLCEYREPDAGYFANCRPTEDPRSTPT